MPVLAHFFGVIAPIMSVSAAIPTAGRPLRTRSVAGLSFGTASLGLLCSQLWLTYGLMISDTSQVAANAVWVTIKVAILVAVVLAVEPQARSRTAVLAAGALLAGIILATFGATVVGVVAAVLTVTANMPQVWLTLHRGAGAGLSTGAVAFNICGATSWTIYGMARGDTAVFWCSMCACILHVVLFTAAITAPGLLLHHARRKATVAMHLDAVIVRTLTRATPTLASAAESHLPTLAAGIRSRHHHLQHRLQTVGALAA